MRTSATLRISLAILTAAVVPAAFAQQCEEPPVVTIDSVERTATTATVHYTTNGVRMVEYYRSGEFTLTPVDRGPGSFSSPLGIGCLTEAEEYRIEAVKDPDCPKLVVSTMIAPFQTPPLLRIVQHPGDESTQTNFYWDYLPPDHTSGALRLLYFSADKGKETLIDDEKTPHISAAMTDIRKSPGMYVFEARSCANATQTREATSGMKSCPYPPKQTECTECVAGPVSVISRNMMYAEEDPLPGFGDVLPFVRVYDSHSERDGAFGSRWASIFSAFAEDHNAFNGMQYVNVVTETGQQYVFRGVPGGPYGQIMPRALDDATTLERVDNMWVHSDGGTLVRFYGAGGKPVVYRDRTTGREVHLFWDEQNRPIRAADSWGAWTYLVHSNAETGRVTSIELQDDPQQSWRYIYDGNRLVRVESPLGLWRTYEYTYSVEHYEWQPLGLIRDGAGRIIESHQYSRNGATTSIQQNNDLTSVGPLESGRIAGEWKRHVTWASGREETYYHRLIDGEWRVVEVEGGCASCGSGASVVAFDPNGNVVRSQDAGGFITERDYDPAGHNVVRLRTFLRPEGCDPRTDTNHCRQTPDSLATVALEETNATVVTDYVYGDTTWPDKPTLVTTASVRKADATRTEAYTYDAGTGEVLSHVVSGWTDDPARLETRTTTTTLYDGTAAAAFNPGGTFDAAWLALPQPKGARKQVDGPLAGQNDSTTYVWYPVHASVPGPSRGRLAAVRNAAGHVTRYENYDLRGNPRRTIDANGVVEERTIDILGRVTAATMPPLPGCDQTSDPLCSNTLTTTYTFNGTGPLVRESAPGGATTSYEYDDRGRVSAISRGPSQQDLRERIETTYDAGTGSRGVEKILGRDPVTGSWVERRRTTWHYDALGRPDVITNGDDTTVAYTYDAEDRLTSVRDENHAAPNTFYKYDAAGRLSEVRQKLGTGFITTDYSYDRDGNLVAITDPNGNTTTYLYDDFGQLLRQTSPVTGVTTYSYDAAGQLLSSTDANGATTTRVYDVLGRVESAVSARAGESETVTWTYDTAQFGTGRVATMTDPTGSTSYEYDRRGLLLRETKTIEGTPYGTAFRYDGAGNRTRIVYPSGRNVNYTFDFAGRPISVAAGATSIVASAFYLPFGPATEVVYGNGTTRRTTYDQRYQPLTNELLGSTGAIARYAYSHDAAGNVTAIRDELDHAWDRTFAYDDLSRLTVANSGAALWGSGSYSYDAMGNLLSSTLGTTSRTFAHAGTTPRLTGVTTNGATRTVSYDSAGNETAAATYSPRNSMRTSDIHAFAYDGRGVRTITSFTSTVLVSSIVLSPSAVRGGESIQGTVTLTGPAPAGGAIVRLVASQGSVRVPESVVVPAGATSATFTVETAAVTADNTVSVNAIRGMTATTNVSVWRSCAIASLALDRSATGGGSTVNATLSLHAPAGPGGTTIVLTSSNSAVATVPSSITVPAGETSATFQISTTPVSAAVTVSIEAELCGTVTATLEVAPPTVQSLTFAPSIVHAGSPATATIDMTGPAPSGGVVVSLSSGDPLVAAVPASATIPAGAASVTFDITTTRRDEATSVVISASHGSDTVSATLQVARCTPVAPAPQLSATDFVWFDDVIPAGATAQGSWSWDASQRASGDVSAATPIAAGTHEHWFQGASSTMTPADGDTLFAYVLLDPCNPPREIMIGWETTSGWTYRYWGEDLVNQTWRARAGALPAAGQWVKLEIPAVSAGLHQKVISGLSMVVYGGRAWFDRAGKRACELTDPQPSLEFPSSDFVWLDDAVPTGASQMGTWQWDTAMRVSGTASHTEPVSSGGREHWFVGAAPITPGPNDELFFYAYLDPCNPPRELIVGWFDGVWDHYAYWGEDILQWGITAGGRVRMGDLPPVGEWTRLSVPAPLVRLSSRPVSEMTFGVYGGKVWWDRAGIARCAWPAPDQPSFDPGESIWFDDAIPAGAAFGGDWAWDTTQKVSGTQSMLANGGTAKREFWFENGTTITLGENDNFFVYALIDPCDPPRELMVWLNDGEWSKHALWGERLLYPGWGVGTDMGPVPAGGQWVRLDIPARSLNLANRTIRGFDIVTHSGRVWLDRAGKYTCTAPQAAQPAVSQTEVVWYDDGPPSGAVLTGTWSWDSQQRASGTLSNVIPPGGEKMEHRFTGATTPLNVGANDTLTVYALVDPCDPPREIMIGWYDGTWEHRAFWGDDLFQYGTANTASRHRVGDVPPAGEWVRLEVPAAALGLGGQAVTGIWFSVFAGKAWFDRVGLQPSASSALAPTAAPQTFRARWRERLRTLASVLTRGRIPRTMLWQPIAQATFAAPSASNSTNTLRRYSLYTPQLNLMAETAMTTSAAPPIAHEYIWFNGEPVAQIDTATEEVGWYFNDPLGTPILQTNASESVLWHLERDPYGTPYTHRAGATRHQPLAFPGQEERTGERDASYNIFRWYRSGWGRYTQADPLTHAARLELFGADDPLRLYGGGAAYTYVRAAPTNLVDRWGLIETPPPDNVCKFPGNPTPTPPGGYWETPPAPTKLNPKAPGYVGKTPGVFSGGPKPIVVGAAKVVAVAGLIWANYEIWKCVFKPNCSWVPVYNPPVPPPDDAWKPPVNECKKCSGNK